MAVVALTESGSEVHQEIIQELADFLCRLWDSCFAPSEEVAEVVQYPRISLQPGQSPCEFLEDGEYDLWGMLNPWWIVKVRIHAMCDGVQTLVPRASAAEG